MIGIDTWTLLNSVVQRKPQACQQPLRKDAMKAKSSLSSASAVLLVTT